MWGPHQRHLPVELDSHTTILSSTSRTTLTQTFLNPHGGTISEAQYSFPLYDGVSVVSFKCTIGQKVITGVVKEKYEARAEYDDAVKRGHHAGLLEQLPEAADVFTTKLGNIGKKEQVVVELVYLGELKHDVEKDGVRFTIPASIAPRYGSVSNNSYVTEFGKNATNNGGIRIVVDIVVESGAVIREVQSPSHPIAVTLGRDSKEDESVFQNNRASATLALGGTTELDRDFVIVINAKGQDTPQALLENHPQYGRALMATLVPKFNLPNIHPEIVFLVDRSGSMSGKIPTVIQALKVFLKSLPTSVKFNICSFGSSFQFLFQKSKPYDEGSLQEALTHVDTFDYNFGGTDILSPVNATIKNRLNNTPLEIMVLTDGEIWNQGQLFDAVARPAEEQIRVFTLGIGSGASTSLVEGVARAGNGFAQFVQDGEKMDKKVVRMLKGALTPHIANYQLEVRYATKAAESDEGFEIIESFTNSMKETVPPIEEMPKTPIQLFTSDFKEDAMSSSKGRYDHLPTIAVPKILQAPHSIPALYAFNRTTVYLLFGPNASERPIESVILRGHCEYGPLELKIPVQDIGEGETIHQLAAKKAIQDLEEGRGWITEAKSANGGLLKKEQEGDWHRIVEREAVRLGTQFQVAGKHCSFVAVESVKGENDDGEARMIDSGERAVTSSQSSPAGPGAPPGGFGAAPMRMLASPMPMLNQSMAFGQASSMTGGASAPFGQSFSSPGGQGGSSLFGATASAFAPSPTTNEKKKRNAGNGNRTGLFGVIGNTGGGLFGGGGGLFGANSAAKPAGSSPSAREGGLFGSSQNQGASSGLFGNARTETVDRCMNVLPPPPPPPPAPSGRAFGFSAPMAKHANTQPAEVQLSTVEQRMHQVIALQEFNGSWKKIDLLLQAIDLDRETFRTSLLPTMQDEQAVVVKATAIAIAWLESNAHEQKEVWEMVVDKARQWLADQPGVDDVESLVGMIVF